ncbi:penicillin-binding transpeptidase domain-containing protein [Planomicrobium sp. MB-3u-38]|uniref:penicillin-binding transpeptidase domain-containing protein n=1 Tax=Planomicrobium sp. MB-3u-38 TaxID=2058318 RepID=UPI000C7BFF3D|nr:penicillin-binding transpeptidase domain-containing protein [Planomicrobium sp. MB-3u-38]PKH11109.1 penicillin-binding protein [Planomicrobium sp. MB-3u-38]
MKKKFRFQWGAFLLFLVFAGLFFLLLARIVTIQATGQVEGQELAAKAAAKYSQEEVLTAERGKILDRSGEIIAEDTLSYKLVAVVDEKATQKASDPRHVTDINLTADILSKYIGTPREKIYETLKQGQDEGRYQVEFGSAGREISHTQMLEMKEEELPGVLFIQNLKRLYPNGVFASHLIGFAMKEELENGDMVTKGKMGLELIYDDILTGENGKVEFDTDKWGFLLPNSESAVTPAVDGADIKLTLDKTLENFLEDAMSSVQEEYDPKRMIALIANPKTGEILAMSQRPSFNPNTREGLSENWLNESIQLTIEPGSPMKMFTLAAAVEEGKWNPNATYQSGSYQFGNTIIGDHNGRKGWGTISYLEGFQRSSNVSMAYLLERIGPDTFMNYIDAFGFGKKTGIDLPGEAAGKILDEREINKLTLTFGQGSTVTPIQMIQATTAFANDGVMMKPYIIDEIKNRDTGEVTLKGKPEEAGQPISAETAKIVRDVMASTVTAEEGSGKRFALQDYTVAGKTGTAQIPGDDGRYMTGKDNYLFSFVGMAPAEDPELVMYVGVQQPNMDVTEHGSKPVADIFTSVMENGLKYLNIEPEDIEETPVVEIGDYAGKTSDEVAAELGSRNIKVATTGSAGEVSAQYPEKGEMLLAGGTVILQTEGETVLPDFKGWSKRELLAFQALSGLSLEIVGQGYAVNQSLSAGVKIAEGEPVVVRLQTPEDSYKVQMTDGPEGIPEEENTEEIITEDTSE